MLTPTATLHAVAHAFGITVTELTAKGRLFTPARARQAAYMLCRDLHRRSYPEIGRLLGERDHTTVMAGERRARLFMVSDPWFRERVEMAQARIREADGPGVVKYRVDVVRAEVG